MSCQCPERMTDEVCYGIHICRDGKRIAPEDFYAEAPDDLKAVERVAAIADWIEIQPYHVFGGGAKEAANDIRTLLRLVQEGLTRAAAKDA